MYDIICQTIRRVKMIETTRDNNILKKVQCLNGGQLKIIAIISMVIDHANKSIIYPCLQWENPTLIAISDIFDIIGRIAFPLFCFFIVEGFFKTHSRWKYMRNLLIVGVISEVPFDMCTTASFYDMNWNNVMFTLALVLAVIWLIDTLKEKVSKGLWVALSAIILLAGCAAAMFLALDYEHYAILIGYFFYIFYQKRIWAVPFGYASMYTQPWSLLGFGLTLTYNGERGKQVKWLMYLVYPIHLLILGTIRLNFGL